VQLTVSLSRSRVSMLSEAVHGESREVQLPDLMLKFLALENGFGCLSQARSRQGEMMHMNNLAVGKNGS